jgi:hypothetical protein
MDTKDFEWADKKVADLIRAAYLQLAWRFRVEARAKR